MKSPDLGHRCHVGIRGGNGFSEAGETPSSVRRGSDVVKFGWGFPRLAQFNSGYENMGKSHCLVTEACRLIKFDHIASVSCCREIFVISVIICIASFGCAHSAHIYNVLDFGAVGNGISDDSQAFLKAWARACGDGGPNPSLRIPAGKTFLLKPVVFNGPCKSTAIGFQVLGNLIAPNTIEGWGGASNWLTFHGVDGLKIFGSGRIGGQGAVWWSRSCRRHPEKKCTDAPTALLLDACNDLHVTGITLFDNPRNHISIDGCNSVYISSVTITAPANSPNTDGIDIVHSQYVNIWQSTIGTAEHMNEVSNIVNQLSVMKMVLDDELQKCTDAPTALLLDACNDLHVTGITLFDNPRNHISIDGCTSVYISSVTITAPANSPNTDGIDIVHSQYVNIWQSTIGTGDDCIAIGNGGKNIKISWVHCGPGHGISIGSLGQDDGFAAVEQVQVLNCTFTGTSNGARIKTWPGGSGYARRISFEDMHMNDTDNPIIIDQYYCDGHKCHNQTSASAVDVSDVRFVGFHGTSSKEVAINLECSNTVGCTDIVLNNVQLTPAVPGMKLSSYCNNAHGPTCTSCVPQVPCLS
ncbi:probable polygalacturonase At3g15720 [Magnolia sinica]|uniref:probable polygalacturonase At3g15720 n=1 Tax=Magnolia sinica TaxID=86752 RepID=UPI0026598D73|nr:probable polygalacturonase At3g15720 [Magnolia sinica]